MESIETYILNPDAQKPLIRMRALAMQWDNDPRMKEVCRRTWDPIFFAECEAKIEKLKQVGLIEQKHFNKSSIKYLDISEIDVEAWEKQLYD